ncbi:HsdR family type I site-specific deoxyribonuclease [uncultured Haemophilus sp.]|uniref:type I restriction endonuclease subunit R, EcoR124 family n=1 Tax=uncultured Haemophilus sp. TaxID=237779 RepID=UPI002590E592|nr:HsdR family type I site-specific deoxyribonuclease [uncultured Haemophilus sp.]
MQKSLSELAFEKEIIKSLDDNGWHYRPDLSHGTEEKLLSNWREVLNRQNVERLKDTPLTDEEFEQIKSQVFAINSPLEAARFLSTGQVIISREINGQKSDLILECFWSHDVAGGKNSYEVVNQITRKKNRATGQDHRFDVTLLISGIPVIHLELKREGVSIEQAYWQIRDYMGNGDFGGFYSLVQIFGILNGSESRYFARPTDYRSFNYTFCFGWADEKTNQPIQESSQFIKHALRVPMGHKLMSLYTIADKPKGILKVLRSYQIYAVENILERLANRTRFDGSLEDRLGGFIWHTTGSGKTMTSFKVAQLACELKNVDKVIFLADRNELVKQTFNEYSGFVDDEDDVTATKSSNKLLAAILNPNQRLIVTSIQKMDNVAKLGEQKKLNNTHIVFIVDEAHRSTAGQMLSRIKLSYPTAVWFGFTGTPILDENSKGIEIIKDGEKVKTETTASLFGNRLHVYSVADGIFDKNVLGFDVRKNYPIPLRTLRNGIAKWKDPSMGEVYRDYLDKKKVSDLEIEQELSKSFYEKEEWVQQVSSYILDCWEQNSYSRQFSAMLAVNDIKSANRYFKALKDNPLGLKIAVIYDPNGEYNEGSFEDTSDLENAIIHYNNQFDTHFGLESVPQYKDDLMRRLARRDEFKKITTENRDHQLDLVIVVWQLLTGFDVPYLNTLYLDKVLDYANLIQAFSRTNRVLNEQKPYGIIEYFRSPILMSENIEKAFKLYSNKNASGAFFVPSKKENIEKINRTFEEISQLFPEKVDTTSGEILPNFYQLPEDEESQKQFAKFFNEFEKTMIALRQQGFVWDNPKETKEVIFSESQYRELQARYADLDKINREPGAKKAKFEIDPNLVSGDSTLIDKDYLMKLLNELAQAQAKAKAEEAKEIEARIQPLFNQLRENDRLHAEQILDDVKTGKLERVENFSVLLDRYRMDSEQTQIQDFISQFGLDRECFGKLQAHHVLGKDDWKDFGLLDNLVKSADMDLVITQFSQEKPGEKPNTLKLKGYLRDKIKTEIERIILAR